MGVHGEHRHMVSGPQIVAVPVLSDNYVWLMHSGEDTVVVDPGAAAPVLDALAERGWTASAIWNTHWHPDHTGGNAELKAATGAPITGPAAEADRIPTLDHTVTGGDRLDWAGIEVRVIDTPAHTAGHISFHLPEIQVAFVGDTLFAMGCGRLFEGTAAQMFAAMRAYDAMPGETRLYPAHEYTLSNARFAASAEPDNRAIADRLAEVERLRSGGTITLPTTVAAERATNPFLRAGDAATLARLRRTKDAA